MGRTSGLPVPGASGPMESSKREGQAARRERTTRDGRILSSLAGLVSLASANPPFETVGYGRSSPRDFSGFLEHGANSGISRMGFGIYRIFN